MAQSEPRGRKVVWTLLIVLVGQVGCLTLIIILASVLAGLWLAYASFGLIVGSLAPLVVFVSEDLNLSRSSMGSVMGAWPLVYIAFSIPAGALIDRLGLRISITLGIILIALSGLSRALAVNAILCS